MVFNIFLIGFLLGFMGAVAVDLLVRVMREDLNL